MSELLEILGCGALILAFIAPAILIVVFALRKPKSDDRICQQCHYPKYGSQSATCPECGAQWRDTSIWHGQEGREIILFLGILFFFLVVLPMALIGLISIS